MVKEYIGVDIGGTKIAIVKGTETGEILQKERFENDRGVDFAIAKIIETVKSFGKAEAIGISCGGPLDPQNGRILSPPNLPGWDDIPITSMLEKECGIPAYLCNDADACALAEWRFGAGKGCRNMVFLTFGTGLGAGLILNGALYSGSTGGAGEVGHIRMSRFGPVGYGKSGSLEGFASGGGIAQLAQTYALERLQCGESTAYCKSKEELERVTAATVANAAKNGDPIAKEVYRKAGEMLGRGLAVLIDLLNPERIVIGSIYVRSADLLIPSMKEAIFAEALPTNAEACKILPAELGESLGDIAALSVAIDQKKREEEK
ncbi:MAG: ROK family protein [Clostridia bacterium]|nr:ROK family protein [Clostridia bacterium]